MRILKRDGRAEPFEPQKIITTLKRSGFSLSEAEKIASEVSREVFEGIKSRHLLRIIKKKIREREPALASLYDLKRALFAFGPTGYSFEDFLARVFLRLDYRVEVRQFIKGECAWHEIDLVLEKKRKKEMVEAKFRANGKGRVEIKEALYTYARLLDLKTANFTGGYLITNARFTSEVVSYAECCGLKLLSWDYPDNSNLAQLIERNKLYPVTLLSGLSGRAKKALLEGGVILLEDLTQLSLEVLKDKGFSEKEAENLKKSALKLLKKIIGQ